MLITKPLIFIANEAMMGGTDVRRKNEQILKSFPKEKKKVLANMESFLIHLRSFSSF